MFLIAENLVRHWHKKRQRVEGVISSGSYLNHQSSEIFSLCQACGGAYLVGIRVQFPLRTDNKVFVLEN